MHVCMYVCMYSLMHIRRNAITYDSFSLYLLPVTVLIIFLPICITLPLFVHHLLAIFLSISISIRIIFLPFHFIFLLSLHFNRECEQLKIDKSTLEATVQSLNSRVRYIYLFDSICTYFQNNNYLNLLPMMIFFTCRTYLNIL